MMAKISECQTVTILILFNIDRDTMSMVSEMVFSDVLSMAQTIGIIGTLALTFFFYKRHIQHLAMHTESETLRGLEDKIHRLNIMSFEHPELTKVQTNRQLGLDTIYAFDVLNVYHQAFKMHQRRVLKDPDWYGWLHWMRHSFREGTIPASIISCNYEDVLRGRVHVFDFTNLC